MIKQAEIDKISEQIDRMAQVRKSSKDKTLAYQHKILQLLLQEKTTRLMNETLSAEITRLSTQKEHLNSQVVILQSKLQAETERYRTMETSYTQKLEETLRQVGLAKMKWLDLEDKNQELHSHAQLLQQQIQQVNQENRAFKQSNEEAKRQCEGYKIKSVALEQQQADLRRSLAQIDLKVQNYQRKLANTERQLSSTLAQLTHLRTINQTVQSQKEALNIKVSELSISLDKSKAYNAQYQSELHQLHQDLDLLSEKSKNLERENQVLKDRKKDIEDDTHKFELERETMTANLKKLEKQIKRLQQELKQRLSKEQELEEEVVSGAEKIKNLDKALKKYKKEVQELKEALLTAEQTSGNQASRMKKWQVTARSQRQRISQLQQSLSVKDQQLTCLQSQLQACEKTRFQLGFQLQKASKEKQVLSELNLQLQERRVLMQGEREKALSQLVKQKDVYSRANFKLLQILELKEQTIKAILKAIQNGEQKIELPGTVLASQRDLQQLLSGSGWERLMNPRQRPKYLSEWLGRK